MLIELAKQLKNAIDKKENLVWKDGYFSLIDSLVPVMLDFPEKPEGFDLKVEKPKTYKKVVLVSGGMDSTIMWWLNREEKDKLGLYVDLGQKYAELECQAIDRAKIEPVEVLVYPLKFEDDWKHIIPTRNFLLIALAEQYVAHEGEIWIGAVQGESAPDKGDKSELFFRLCEELIWRTKRKKVTIKTLKDKTKNDWLKMYLDETKDESILQTITCFNGTEKPCGTCQACVRKWIAMKYCGLNTNNFFEQDPYIAGKQFIEKYKQKFTEALEKKEFIHYSKDRAEQDLNVILEYEKSI